MFIFWLIAVNRDYSTKIKSFYRNMSEAKRVTLTTISSNISSSLTTGAPSGNFRFGADFLPQTDKSATAPSAPAGTKVLAKTIRLNVELFQTDSNKYPEFNYAKLLHLEKVRTYNKYVHEAKIL